jgi:hypothetical protein
MSGPFKEEYWQAVVKEIETLESIDAWEIVDHTNDMNVISSIWAFKLKRFPAQQGGKVWSRNSKHTSVLMVTNSLMVLISLRLMLQWCNGLHCD